MEPITSADVMLAPCPVCRATNAPASILGLLFHYMCRRCGIQYSLSVGLVEVNHVNI